MKTNRFPIKKISIFSVFGIMALLIASCGSYQSSSYYDRDGIYGGDRDQRTSKATSQSPQGNQYKDYFGSLQQDNPEIFTDVENYNTSYAETPSTQAAGARYAGWGEDTDNITVNVYGGNWGAGYWNNYWYGPYWGWGWNSWYGPSWSIGLGWNSWYGGLGYPYYGYYGYYGWPSYYGGHWHHNHYSNHSYSYNNGRRGNSYSTGTRSYTAPGRNYTTGRTFTRNNTSTPRSSTYSTPRNTQPRSEASAPRQNNSNYSTPRSSAPTRSYTPSSSGGSRSSGGGTYGGGGGGSRGGGGRR